MLLTTTAKNHESSQMAIKRSTDNAILEQLERASHHKIRSEGSLPKTSRQKIKNKIQNGKERKNQKKSMKMKDGRWR